MLGGRLFRCEYLMVVNATRATISRWHDRLIVVTMLLVSLAVLRSWFTDRPWMLAAWVGFGGSFLVGIALERLIAARLAFHASEGLLAADALQRTTSWRFTVAWLAIGLVAMTVATFVARPSLLVVSLPGYLIGAFVSQIIGALSLWKPFNRKAKLALTIRTWARHPTAGFTSAVVLLLSLPLLVRILEQDAFIAAGASLAVLFLLALTIVDDGLVRFMTISGHDPWRTVARHARAALLFTGTAVPGCLLAFGPLLAGIVGSFSAFALFLLAIRVLAYCSYGKRLANILVSVLLALLTFVAFSLPHILPLVVVTIVWQLQRHAWAKTWVLA